MKKLAWGDLLNLRIEDVFPENGELIEEEFLKYKRQMQEREDYVDSFRIGLVNDKDSMKQYDEMFTCCGSNETTVVINNKLYSFGCNFGH